MNIGQLKAALIARGYGPADLTDCAWSLQKAAVRVWYYNRDGGEGLGVEFGSDPGPEIAQNSDGSDGSQGGMIDQFLALPWIGSATVAHVLGLPTPEGERIKRALDVAINSIGPATLSDDGLVYSLRRVVSILEGGAE